MIIKNKRFIGIVVLTFLLLFMVIFSNSFQMILNNIVGNKGSTVSRTPMYIYFFQHLYMVIISSLISVVIGVGVGLFVTTDKGKEYKEILLKLVNLGQAFPSPALLALMVPILGYGSNGALIALVIYALMPIIYNTVTGIEQVSKEVLEAGKGMGMNNYQLYKTIKIPLAMKSY